MATGLCTNRPQACARAAGREPTEMATANTVCPECGAPLKEQWDWRPWFAANQPTILVSAGFVVALGVITTLLFSSGLLTLDKPPAAFAKSDDLLRISTSPALGWRLATPLAKAWLAAKGATAIKVEQDTSQRPTPSDNQAVTATLGGKSVRVAITADGTDDAFADLAGSAADIAMTGRSITARESERGDLKGQVVGHSLGVDGIAVIIAPGGALTTLTMNQLQALFRGMITNWTQVGGGPGEVRLYGLNEDTDAAAVFETTVLHGAAPGQIRRFAGNIAEEKAVAGDPAAVGFISMAFAKTAKALALGGEQAVAPTLQTVASGRYALRQPLWLYTAANPVNGQTKAFVDFALSGAGAAVVRRAGFAGGDHPVPHWTPPQRRHARRAPRGPLRCPRNKVAMTDIKGAKLAEPYDCTPLDR